MSRRDTIYALSSGLLPSGVAVIRISGPHARYAAETMTGGLPPARSASLRSIRSRNGDLLDEGLVLFFPAPRSFTGEDCIELQVHGSRAVVAAILAELAAFEGMRDAEAGEFTRRAFENGRLDLTEVEGLADLIAAETEFQRRLALDASQGRLRDLYEGWSNRLAKGRAWIEAEFDFSDEDDIPGSMQDRIWPDIRGLIEELDRHLSGALTGERLRSGFKIVLTGAVNAGKSSLLNALAQRDAAIVSPIPGTTRDAISVQLDIGGYPVTLIDTAGLRQAGDPVEQEGIRRAERAVAQADIILHLLTDETTMSPSANPSAAIIPVMSKSDLGANEIGGAISVSAHTGDGLELLVATIRQKLMELYPVQSLALPSRARQTRHLSAARTWLDRALTSSDPLELRAEHLRFAQDELGHITGRVSPDDLLGHIFAEFCIGK